MNNKLKPCQSCGKDPIIEGWSSGGRMYMAKCNNPDCAVPADGYPKGHNLDDVITEWNLRAECKRRKPEGRA